MISGKEFCWCDDSSTLSNLLKDLHRLTQIIRLLQLIMAVTIHNIPEGLAVGVAFGAAGQSSIATFESARNLAIGIGLQNFPEGLAVSLPLKAAGFSAFKSIWFVFLETFYHLFLFLTGQ